LNNNRSREGKENNTDPRMLLYERDAIEALNTLIEVAVKLKETGLLDLLVVLADRYDEILALLNKPSVANSVMIVDAVLDGIGQVDVSSARPGIERASKCIVRSFSSGELKKAPRIRGILDLVRALRDPRVAKGLSLILGVAGIIGSCVLESED
jgi:uncharacterized protein YjgD (DUF1641 family)